MKSICVIHCSGLETCSGGQQSLHDSCLHADLSFNVHICSRLLQMFTKAKTISQIQDSYVRFLPAVLQCRYEDRRVRYKMYHTKLQVYGLLNVEQDLPCPGCHVECLSLPSTFGPCAGRLEILAVSPALQVCLS